MQTPQTKTELHPKSRGHVLLQREGLRVHHLVMPPGAELPDHTAADDVVVVITRGKGIFTVSGEPRHVEAGDVLDFIPGESHAVEALTELEMIIMHAELAHGAAPH